jgi:phage recombination protein Bet
MSRIESGAELSRISNGEIAPTFTQEKIELLKRTICRGASNDELELFVHACKRTGLDPFMKQVYALKRWQDGKEVMTIQTGIDGYRLIAERTGKYMPGREPTFEYDGDNRLIKATAYVQKLDVLGAWHEIAASAFFEEYCGYKKDGSITQMWRTKPHILLSKCAEALALRRAFPAELSGVYTSEEMEQAGPHIEPTIQTETAVAATTKQESDVQITADGEPNLADDATFNEEWTRIATARNINPKTAINFLNVLSSKPKHKPTAHTVEWRQEAINAFRSGKFDGPFKGKEQSAPPTEEAANAERIAQAGNDLDSVTDKPTKADAVVDEKQSRLNEAKRVLAEATAAGNKEPAPSTSNSRPIDETDMKSIEDFWFLMTEIDWISNKHTIQEVEAAVNAFAARSKKTADTLSPADRLRIYKFARVGKFSIPEGKVG